MKRADFIGLLLVLLALSGCATTSDDGDFLVPENSRVSADKLLPVDCLLPAQVRQLGSRMSYLAARRAVKATAFECEMRGGEYVAYDRANYRTALIVWLDKAKKGDAEAQTYVGEIYEKGLGLEPDYELAQRWYLKAAEQDYSRAQINLGYLYEKGLGVEKNTVKALNWYRKASGVGDDDIEYSSAIEVKAATLAQENTTLLRAEVDRREREIQVLNSSLSAASEKLSDQERLLQEAKQKLHDLKEEMKFPSDNTDLDEVNHAFEAQKKQLEQLENRYQVLKSKASHEKRLVKSKAESVQIQKQVLATQPMAGPSIEVFDPSIVITRGGEPTVRVRSASNARVISGRIVAPAGLKMASIDERTLSIDSSGSFHSAISVTEKSKRVTIQAIDQLGQEAKFSFMLVPNQSRASPKEEVSNFGRIAQSINFGRFYALVIGNNEYSHFPTLQTAVSDSKRIAEILEEKYGYDVRLINNADRYTILSALNEIKGKMSEKDNLLVYYAGHGERDVQSLQGYWLPVDAELENTANWIPNSAISALFNTMKAKHILVIADSCYSGSMTRSSVARLDANLDDKHLEKWLKVMAKTDSRTVLTSGGLKPVLDGGGGKYSVFAKEFIAELEQAKGAIDAYKIYLNILPRVQQNAAALSFKQTPTYAPIKHTGHGGGEFIFVAN